MKVCAYWNFPPTKKPQNITQKNGPKQANKKPSEMSLIQTHKKGNSKVLHSVYDRPLFPFAIPMIQAKQLGFKKTNNEGIWWQLP